MSGGESGMTTCRMERIASVAEDGAVATVFSTANLAAFAAIVGRAKEKGKRKLSTLSATYGSAEALRAVP